MAGENLQTAAQGLAVTLAATKVQKGAATGQQRGSKGAKKQATGGFQGDSKVLQWGFNGASRGL